MKTHQIYCSSSVTLRRCGENSFLLQHRLCSSVTAVADARRAGFDVLAAASICSKIEKET